MVIFSKIHFLAFSKYSFGEGLTERVCLRPFAKWWKMDDLRAAALILYFHSTDGNALCLAKQFLLMKYKNTLLVYICCTNCIYMFVELSSGSHQIMKANIYRKKQTFCTILCFSLGSTSLFLAGTGFRNPSWIWPSLHPPSEPIRVFQ